MPTIVLASPKGGAGKSTSAVVLGTQFAEQGATTALIDADPNQPLAKWAKRPGKPDNLAVIGGVTEETIIEAIEEAAATKQFVVVDLEGTASAMVAYAMSRADLVIIPTQGSQLDATEAVKAIRFIKVQERAFQRSIPYVVLLTRTSPTINPRTLQSIVAEFDANGIPVLLNRLNELDAFKAVFSFGGSLSNLDTKQVGNIKGAITLARKLSAEVIEHLLAIGKGQEQEKVA